MLVLSKISNLTVFLTIALVVSLTQTSVAAEGKIDANKKKMDLSMVIKCSTEINDAEWTKIKAANVHVKIENVTKEMQAFAVIPSFVLEKDGSEAGKEMYWSPIELMHGSAKTKDSKPDNLTLKEGESITFDVDVFNLNWGRSISALWPFQNLFSIVPPGQYKFYLDLEIVGGRNSKRVRSRDIMVTIKY